MRQIGLFDEALAETEEFTEPSVSAQANAAPASQHTERFHPDFHSWLKPARRCLANSIPPNSVWWTEDRSKMRITKNSHYTGDPAFMQDAKAASCHSSDDRWALLYSILWRMNHDEPQLLELAGDSEVTLLRNYSKAVARDVHKMKAFVRFRKVEGEPPRFVSWFEPEHYIVEYAAPFFKRRFANMQWSILTPVGCVHWEGEGNLWFSEAVDQQVAPANDQFEDAWRVYYKSIFNPARLKVTAMQSEMPKKYWKNLPEAQEIQALISSAENKTRSMIDQVKDNDKLQCGARPSHPDQLVQEKILNASLSALQATRLKASLCSDCPQASAATQTVFGMGPEDARIMIIGEQPGDQEDLQGIPFTGPAGQLLSAALKRAGIDRDQCYLTNAVKHFGFVPRGKRRIHKRPDASVVSACGHWLQKELQIVDPDIVIYLGATAASTRFGRHVRVENDRGHLIQAENRKHLITAHPSSILRLQPGLTQQSAYVKFVNDLKQCSVSKT
ncbi:UdgX family uracil-DNA binding protein [Granulosicoccus sp.]|nr:UdgX family uracil-DNA binding protein [Granulosicoccus sp.]